MLRKLAISTLAIVGSVLLFNSTTLANNNHSTPVWNPGVASTYGNEADFVTSGPVNGASSSFSNNHAVCDGVADLRIYIHNGAHSVHNGTNNDGVGVINGANLSVNIPEGESTSHSVSATLNGINAAAKTDSTNFNCANPVTLEFVPGSAKIYTSAQNGVVLSDAIAAGGTTAAAIGHSTQNGNWPGCFEFQGFVYLKVKATPAVVVAPEQKVDLELTKYVQDNDGKNYDADDLTGALKAPVMNVGDTFSYFVSLQNEGPDAATGVEVSDKIPAGLSIVGTPTATHGTVSVSGQDVTWTAGDMALYQKESLTVKVKINEAGTITNTAAVTAADQTDIDSTPGNDVASEDDQDPAVIKVNTPVDPKNPHCTDENGDGNKETSHDGATCTPDTVYTCDAIDVVAGDKTDHGMKVKFTIKTSGDNGVEKIVVNFGDGTSATITDGTMVEHFYEKAGDYKVVATIDFDNNQEIACETSVKINENKTVVTVPGKVLSTTKVVEKTIPTQGTLPKTGASAATALFGLSAIGASLKGFATSRKNLKDTLLG